MNQLRQSLPLLLSARIPKEKVPNGLGMVVHPVLSEGGAAPQTPRDRVLRRERHDRRQLCEPGCALLGGAARAP